MKQLWRSKYLGLFKKTDWNSYLKFTGFAEKKIHVSYELSDSMLSTLAISKSQKFLQDKCLLKNLLNNTQVRYFKTVRNIKAENSRNPSLYARFRNWIGPGTDSVSLKVDNYLILLNDSITNEQFTFNMNLINPFSFELR